MSIHIEIPVDSKPIVTANSFTATFNAPTINRYDWGVAANLNNLVINLDQWSVYVIERVNFSMTVSESAYQEALIGGTEPAISLKYQSNNQVIFLTPQPFINYVDNLELLQYFWTTQNNDALLADFTGVIAQSAAMGAPATIDALISFNIYRVISHRWVKNFIDQKLALGEHLKHR